MRCAQEHDEEFGLYRDATEHDPWLCRHCLDVCNVLTEAHIRCDRLAARPMFGGTLDICGKPVCIAHVQQDDQRGDLCPTHWT